MTDRDEYLRERAFKGGRFSVAERVLHTPIDDKKALKWLVSRLHEKGILSVDDIDMMLYEARPPGA
jgi:hypothetical protein